MDGSLKTRLAESLPESIVRLNREYRAFVRFTERELEDNVIKSIDQFLDPYFAKSSSQLSEDQNSAEKFLHSENVRYPMTPDDQADVYCEENAFLEAYKDYCGKLSLRRVDINSEFWLTLSRYGITKLLSSTKNVRTWRQWPRDNGKISGRLHLKGIDLKGSICMKDESVTTEPSRTRAFCHKFDYTPARQVRFAEAPSQNQWSWDYFMALWPSFVKESGFGGENAPLNFVVENCRNKKGVFDRAIPVRFYTEAKDNLVSIQRGASAKMKKETVQKLERLRSALELPDDVINPPLQPLQSDHLFAPIQQ